MAFGGCTTAPELKPHGMAVIPIETKADRAVGSARLLNEVTIELPAITTPGNQWTIVSNDPRYLKQLRPIMAAGAGEKWIASFLAIQPGHRLVRFAALPPNAKEAEPSQIYEAVVDIE